jgi:RNAse (barnase) inhibitor barstar
MAVFKDNEWRERLDWNLLLNGACTLYYRPEILAQDEAWLREHGYEVHVFDCASWTSEDAFHEQISRDLGFPDYYGRNLAALNDCLAEMNVPDEGGLALRFNRFDLLAQTLPEFAWHVLDNIEEKSRMHLLFGHRLIALVQSDNPRIQFKPVGARPIVWNWKEQVNRLRG